MKLVKRLIGNMGKVADEQFKNEVILMTKLQHRKNSGNIEEKKHMLERRDFLEIVGSNKKKFLLKNEVIRCIHTRLLCVQENHVHRPTMATIVLMLNSYSAVFPPPQQQATHSHHNRTQSGTTTTRLI
ncbi:hypothetical protein G4B88_026708 [Cannabis sativa]|uniref:Uncharacterized protein n=1 Tax=Cannabis sativa TaxID=3483 RepID=A0A7J6DVU1_CANSA|nr:hypothetical protein G4B88_026708 [Cannabis sativa]